MHFLGILKFLVLVALSEQVTRYDNYKVYRVIPSTDDQVKQLATMEGLGTYDFWSSGRKGIPTDIMVPPHLDDDFDYIVSSLGLKPTVLIDNVQEIIDKQKATSRSTGAFGWQDYHRLDAIYEWLYSLESAYPGQVEVVKGGDSFEGREILGVHVSFSSSNANNAVFLEAGIHAREWISPAATTWILNELLSSSDPAVRRLAESYDWYVFPVTNPDGYEFTHTNNRLWRKTRTPYGLFCVGADPNRNWDFRWNTGGASSSACFDTYAGPYAFSEVETATLSEYINGVAHKLKAYISVHSFSQLLLLPYGVTGIVPDNFDQLYEIGLKSAQALSVRHGTQYTVGNIVDVLYVASGSSLDWVKGVHNVNLTYVYELRDTGRFGFLLPAEQIIPTGEETLDSLIVMLE